MPETATLIASLIVERPMCIACIATRAATPEATVKALFTRIAPVVWYGERCRACGQAGIVFSRIRESVA